jgi:hypothetical protein
MRLKQQQPTDDELIEKMGSITGALSGVAFALVTQHGVNSRQFRLIGQALSSLDELREMIEAELPDDR